MTEEHNTIRAALEKARPLYRESELGKAGKPTTQTWCVSDQVLSAALAALESIETHERQTTIRELGHLETIKQLRRDVEVAVTSAERAKRELAEAVRDHLAEMDRGVDLVRQVEAAEALVVRQREALREIVRVAETTYWDDPSAGVCEIARAALVSLPGTPEGEE